MKDRINKILEHYQLSSAQFAENIGVQRSSISHIISGRNKPSYDFIVKIIEHFNDLSTEWLLTGKGSMLKTTSMSPSASNNADLFSPSQFTSQNTPESTINKGNNESNSRIPDAKIQHIQKPENLQQTSRVTNVNKVKSIIFIYEDDTFEVINHK